MSRRRRKGAGKARKRKVGGARGAAIAAADPGLAAWSEASIPAGEESPAPLPPGNAQADAAHGPAAPVRPGAAQANRTSSVRAASGFQLSGGAAQARAAAADQAGATRSGVGRGMTMLIDQATRLRSLARLRQRASVIAITSGKGGVGKSNIAVNLAIHLSAVGKRVVLLDADLGLANADVLCNLDLPANLSHVLSRKKELSDVTFDAPGGFRLIGGASGLARMADLDDDDRQRLIDAMSAMEESADIILIDTGAGISPTVLSFTRAADDVLVVTTPEPTAIADAYAVIKVISRRDAGDGTAGKRRLSLLVNLARNEGEAKGVYERIAKVARQFLGVGVGDAGRIALDEHVPAAVRRRTPFALDHPRCPASESIRQLAMRLSHGAAAPVGERGGGGFFHRFSRWFGR